MSEFDKHQIITLDIHKPEKIESALHQYQALLKSGDAFNPHHFDVEFKQQDAHGVRRLQPSDAGENLKLLKAALNMGQEGGRHYYAHEITDEREVYISEVILFAAALQYPQLKPSVVETAKSIVAYARRVNDTDDMWLDDMRVFGIEALYMLAKTDLQYAYLVGQFFVPYWDDEHATQYEEYLATLLNEHGWHPEVIKAFIWCDNSSFRLGMFMADPYSEETTHQPLGEYLQQNPSQYDHFKQMVLERFIAEPVLLETYDGIYDDEPDEAEWNSYKPVIWLYQTLFAGRYACDEQEDSFMQQPFMASTLEDEAYDLQCYIESQVTTDLVKPADSALEKRAKYLASRERDDRRYDLNYGSEVLKPLILALPQGECLWRYIEDGSEIDALETLSEVELLPLARQHAPEMADHIDDHVHKWAYNNQGVADEVEGVLDLVRGDLLTDHFGQETTIEHANGLTITLNITPDSEAFLLQARCEQYLRVIDVFYRALGKREFSEYMMESLTDEEQPLMSRQDYYRRYSQLPVPQTESDNEQDGALTREIQSIFYAFTDVDGILYKKNLQMVDSVLRSSRERCHPKHYPRAHMGFMALTCYQLHTDFNQRIRDQVSEALINDLNQQNIWQQAVDKMLDKAFIKGGYHCPEHKGLTEHDVARVRDYFCAENPSEDQESVMALLEPQLVRDQVCRGDLYLNKFSEYQQGYDFLHDHDEDFQRFTLMAFWLRQLPLPQRAQADRLWTFITALAPVRVARNVLRAYSDDSWSIEFNNLLDEIDIHDQLIKAGIDRGILDAYRMSRVTGDIEQYSSWLDRYSEITNTSTSMFGSQDRQNAQALHKGLKFINESDRVAFLHHASLKYPNITLDIEHDFKRALQLFIQYNVTSWEFAFAHELGTLCLYVGEGEKVPAKLRKPVIVDDNTVHDKPCHMDGMSWLASTVVQKQGDQYVVLMADNEVPLEIYRSGLPSGMLVIIDEALEPHALLTRIAELQQTSQRITYLVEQTLAYLAGSIDYPTISALYRAQIATENLRPSLDEYRLYSLGQLMWMLEKPVRDKFVKLMFNHDYRGFKFIEQQHGKAWLMHQLSHSEIDFDSYLEEEREAEVSEQGMQFLLNWMLQLEIDTAHMTLFCIKHAEFEACSEFIQAHARGQYGDFKRTLKYLYAGRRAQLPEILSQVNDATQLMEPLTKDRSRLVQEAVANCLLSA
ncbi:MAG: hypothetical protein HRU48_18240 [Vibrio sp.]|uniref:hypothetical protein n=1 Tax=Vibrio TaxID=662 RepID=UPI001EC5587B|nr:hypothetical protein [Vibrio sp.]NRB69279.1 hypothetical protein [Vibrio sp.]